MHTRAQIHTNAHIQHTPPASLLQLVHSTLLLSSLSIPPSASGLCTRPAARLLQSVCKDILIRLSLTCCMRRIKHAHVPPRSVPIPCLSPLQSAAVFSRFWASLWKRRCPRSRSAAVWLSVWPGTQGRAWKQQAHCFPWYWVCFA